MGSATYYASAARALPEELERDIKLVVDNPVTAKIMYMAGGMVVVINEHRQIVAVNSGFQQFLGVEDAEALLGLRPGEAVHCVFSDKMAAGCGTSLQCVSCGIVRAILEARANKEIIERRSALQLKTADGINDLCVWVRACPLEFDGRLFILLFITDITDEEKQCELERMFLHDVLNTALGISSACTLLERRYAKEAEARQYARIAKTLSSRLMKDVRVHKLMNETKDELFRPDLEKIDLRQFLCEIKEIADTWSVSRKVKVELIEPPAGLAVQSDPHLLYRVLTNMLLNACEASAPDGTVRFWAEKLDGAVVLRVWNEAHIPEHIAPRIFQRHFSTKAGRGRGVGTFSMKFISEKLLGGKVSFTSSPNQGTVFSLAIN